ncbi:MAG: hypothetical protein KatS3mg081_1607 [Gemmatimonadales bacterium]|nr:MAG: hypothetical protein KatS3mg081_1607 [Gemmatimonadales bacterium]
MVERAAEFFAVAGLVGFWSAARRWVHRSAEFSRKQVCYGVGVELQKGPG